MVSGFALADVQEHTSANPQTSRLTTKLADFCGLNVLNVKLQHFSHRYTVSLVQRVNRLGGSRPVGGTRTSGTGNKLFAMSRYSPYL
jgi:hypothetical protein